MNEIEKLDKQAKELSKKIDDKETNKERKERFDKKIKEAVSTYLRMKKVS